MGGWAGHRASLDNLGEKKNLLLLAGFKPHAVQPIASHYTDFCRNFKLLLNIGL